MRIAMIGAGRLASSLAPALLASGHDVVQVYSRTLSSALALAERLKTEATDDLSRLTTAADVYILAVKDAVLPLLAATLPEQRPEALFLHTAGSVPMSVFEGHARHYGVCYPMQTFSKDRQADFSKVPVFIEASDEQSLQKTELLARSVSSNVTRLGSEERRHLHLAAVFACNFANHCYALSAQILGRHGLPFSVMLPLIDETAAKVHDLDPLDAQTGPAVRYDKNVIDAQLKLLDGDEQARQVYELMSKSIHQKEINR